MIGFLVVDLLQITRQISFWRIWSANQTQEDKPNAVFALPCLLSRFVLVTVPISLSHHYLQKVYSSQSHTQKTHFHSIIESLISFFFFHFQNPKSSASTTLLSSSSTFILFVFSQQPNSSPRSKVKTFVSG